MDISRLLKAQCELDAMILKKANLSSFKDVMPKIGIALIVEISEFANELQSFKYWKSNKNIDNQKILEEYSDGIHFLNSYAFNYDVNPIIEPRVVSDDINVQLIDAFNECLYMIKKTNKSTITKAYQTYLGLASLLKISDDTIEKEYFKKNEINQQRVKGSY
ncbi:dimeric dUTPase (all-alpha-NTP-PPase superfamily) [Mycoplasma testudineum]|uniref:Dimeric dUTPase (All-alpha-NTP-PPase superfamily) n=1 Tax=Mycoplasma testudineum TaxID=244584 RepID=A0A4R6IC56_9MOLU|nr:dUTP diphosphatase [Mycoplasma testudineum]OYD26693.1 hypothetical protein CG473_02745 [Mycoplasma testudineum]TDO19823.1 dimeric dUTPase (all-alpha-NTP-PPase superfamily) [Mycoplasma testudineum]